MSNVAPQPDTRRLGRFLPAFLGAGVTLLSIILIAQTLHHHGYPQGEAWRLAMITTILLQTAWLPLLSSVWIDRRNGWRPAIGCWIAGGGVTLIAGMATEISLIAVGWAGAMLFAWTALVLAAGYAAGFCGLPLMGRRLCMTVLTVLLVTVPFWSRPVVMSIENPEYRQLGKTLCVWLSPLACLSLPFDSFDYALLPRTYTLWFGPLTPYPPHPAFFIGAYLAIAGIITAGATLIRGRPEVSSLPETSRGL